jgi:hypothetical protein
MRIKKIDFLKAFFSAVVAFAVLAVILALLLINKPKIEVADSIYANSLNIKFEEENQNPIVVKTEDLTEAAAEAESPVENTISAAATPDSFFHEMGINLHESGYPSDNSSQNSINYCKKLAYEGLSNFPTYHVKGLNDLTLTLKSEGKRGMAGNGRMILRCENLDDSEFVAVLTHEMGHIVDGSYLTGNSGEKSEFIDLGKSVFSSDKSVEYYELSWKNNSNWKTGVTENDFCSSYGGTDPYEDFAECYIYYILHGEEFEKSSGSNLVLKQKYEFMKNNVFAGMTYDYDKGQNLASTSLPSDVVRLSYDYDLFINQ